MTEEHLFDLALNASDAERAALLDRECAGDAGLRARIEALLQADAKSNLTMDSPVNRTGSYAERNETAGVVIAGKYKLVELIGEGGMGSVWLAEQSEPVRRRVALKLIKAGMDSKQVIARFEAERQALAVMDHPNIAKVLDGGLHDGRPYFVMELVKGVPITEYCDARKLTPRERLELFVPVCQAIQHAHQKGIIHRDIKPSNVLVAPYDDKPVPKVIDFGLAKATGVSLIDASQATNLGGVVGTPQYMSPEQASLNNLDIDTRSDIYSLGVLLYELLTGSPPFKRKELEKAGMLEILRVIREEEPPRPSTKLSTADALPSLSANRGTEPKKLTGILRNELDWIVMKALEKDRTRRYETANGIAADINRYLAGEPVNAHPPSAGYRMKKFLRKNKGPVIAASLVGLALIGGIIGTGWGLVRAEQARERETQRAEGERLAKEKAQAREAETKAVLEFVENKVFSAARPKDQEGGQGYEVKLADAIAAALPYLEKSFTDQPLIEARLRMTLGKSFSQLGKPDIAEQQFSRARELYAAKLGPDHLATLSSMNDLANSYTNLGRHPEALTLREETLKLFKAKFGPNHPETLRSMMNLAVSYADLGRPEATALLEETLKLQKVKLGHDHPETLMNMHNLANSFVVHGRHAEAMALSDAIMGMNQILIDRHPRDDQKEYLNAIDDSSTMLLSLINEILDYAKIESGKMQLEKISFNIKDCLDAAVNTIKNKAQQKGVEVISVIDPAIPEYVMGDPVRLKQILINLLGNAEKFTAKGKITLAVKVVSNENDSLQCEFKVNDNGIGISPEKLNTIFESFTQAGTDIARKYGGTGLGLAISKQLVELHNSNIKVTSEVNNGTTFSFIIKYEKSKGKAESKQILNEYILEQGMKLKGLRVLLAEDNNFNSIVAVDMLKKMIPDLEIDVSIDGNIAIEQLQKKDYNVLLLDIIMPEMDGYETVEYIRKKMKEPFSSIKIIAMTANATQSEREKCINSGMNGYITKPLDQKDVIDNLIKVLII